MMETKKPNYCVTVIIIGYGGNIIPCLFYRSYIIILQPQYDWVQKDNFGGAAASRIRGIDLFNSQGVFKLGFKQLKHM